MNKIIGILLGFFSLIHAQEPFDIETLPKARTQQYPLDPYKKIVVFSAPRTGSSLVYNIFRYLFEDEKSLFYPYNEFNQNCLVLKTHKFNEVELLKNSNVLFVIVVRNPIDAIISNFRICPNKIDNIQSFVENKIQMHKNCLNFYQKLKRRKEDLIFLKYEDFEGEIEKLFDCIESHFGIQIHEKDKVIIEKRYGKTNVYASVQPLSNFKEYLPISGFHGSHVLLERYTPPEELIYWLNLLIEEAKPQFKKYGYFKSLP